MCFHSSSVYWPPAQMGDPKQWWEIGGPNWGPKGGRNHSDSLSSSGSSSYGAGPPGSSCSLMIHLEGAFI